MMTDDQILEVVTAHKEGKKIQWRYFDSNAKPSSWYTPAKGHHPNWDFAFYEYRVAPEPRKPREWWIQLDDFNGWFDRAYRQDTKTGFIHVVEVLND